MKMFVAKHNIKTLNNLIGRFDDEAS